MATRKEGVRGAVLLILLAALAVPGCLGTSPPLLELPSLTPERAVLATAKPRGQNPAGTTVQLAAASEKQPLPPPAPPPPQIGTAEPTPAPSLTPPPAPNEPDKLQAIARTALERYAAIDSYIVRLRRREQVRGKDQPEEVLLFKFRKQPWSVYFKWLGQEGKGREVVYVKGQHGDKLHTLLAAGDMPFAPAGKRIELAPDSMLVRSASRHGVTDAGVGVVIERLARTLAELQTGATRVTLRYAGLQKRPEFKTPLETVEETLPAGLEPTLPHGGRRLLYFDPASGLPTLVIAYDETGHEVEYYCYDHFQYPVRLDDDDFNPDKLWPRGEKK